MQKVNTTRQGKSGYMTVLMALHKLHGNISNDIRMLHSDKNLFYENSLDKTLKSHS